MGTQLKDIKISPDAPKSLMLEKHVNYIAAYGNKKDDYEYCITEYLRMSGVYWGLTAMDLMGALHLMNKDDVIQFVKLCQHPNGGFGASVNHDACLLYTLSAIQILVIYDSLEEINVQNTVKYISSLQKEDGSFAGDKWEYAIPAARISKWQQEPPYNWCETAQSSVPPASSGLNFNSEIDTRFSFCAVACLSLLDHLDAIDVDKAVDYVLSCMNFDGGFGCRPGSESHSGQIYCCLGVLAITHRLYHVNVDMLGWWLCERQLPSGGLNGRPEKLPDVCYSWWVLASLKIIGKIHWINKDKLVEFILACQDDETGGIADRPGDMVDPFHTLFGIAGLSLLGYDQIKNVNPVFCMPQETIDRLNHKPDTL